ncbi:aldehyde dehydrogenase family protein, partial [Brevirhabdus pacifica]
VGVIGALCADEAPLLGFVTVLGAILATGSRAVLIPSEAAPLAAMDLMQVIETSDVPAGVVNIIAGRHEDLAAPLAGHMDVQAVWSFSSSDLSEGIERASAADLKRTWVNHGRGLDWHAPAGGLKPFLEQATEVKTVWVPYGE